MDDIIKMILRSMGKQAKDIEGDIIVGTKNGKTFRFKPNRYGGIGISKRTYYWFSADREDGKMLVGAFDIDDISTISFCFK